MSNPENRSHEGARIINLDDVRRAKFAEQMKREEGIEAAKSRHPAFKAAQFRKEQEEKEKGE